MHFSRCQLNVVLIALLFVGFISGSVEAQSQVFWTANSTWQYQPCGSTASSGDLFETPPDGFVFPIRCQGRVGSETGLSCDTVTWTVVAFADMVKDIEFEFDENIFEDGSSCNQPTTTSVCGLVNFAQQCGEQVFRFTRDGQQNEQLPAAFDCVPKASSCEGAEGGVNPCLCSVTDLPCKCVRASFFSVRPKSNLLATQMQVDDLRVCFKGVWWVTEGGATEVRERRCVYFDVIVEPDELWATTTVFGSANTPVQPDQHFNATVGQEMHLTLFGRDINEHQALSIDIESGVGTVELPNQRWLGPTECHATGQTTSNLGSSRCTNGYWKRTLSYTARSIEVGVEYSVFFGATEQRITTESYVGAQFTEVVDGQTVMTPVTLTTSSSLEGAHCCPSAGLCSNLLCSTDALESKKHGIDDNVKVLVQLGGISWARNKPDAPSDDLYTMTSPGTFNAVDDSIVHPGTPLHNARLPTAYVNCPIDPFSVIADKPNAVLKIDLMPGGDGYADATEYKLVTIPGPSEEQVFVQEGNNYLAYMGVEWTPPLGSEGRDYRLCFKAFDDFTEATTCVFIKVERCMYCTLQKDSITQVAQRFRTSWLQVWGANDPRLWASNPGKNWQTPESPHELEEGTLIRLGPILQTQHPHTLDQIADRFGTTVRSILSVNPDLMDRMDSELEVVPRLTELCILPEICNPAEGETA